MVLVLHNKHVIHSTGNDSASVYANKCARYIVSGNSCVYYIQFHTFSSRFFSVKIGHNPLESQNDISFGNDNHVPFVKKCNLLANIICQ